MGTVETVRQPYEEWLTNVEKLVRFTDVQYLFNLGQKEHRLDRVRHRPELENRANNNVSEVRFFFDELYDAVSQLTLECGVLWRFVQRDEYLKF